VESRYESIYGTVKSFIKVLDSRYAKVSKQDNQKLIN